MSLYISLSLFCSLLLSLSLSLSHTHTQNKHSPGGRAGTKVTVHAVDVVVRLAHRRLRKSDTIALIYPLVLTFRYARVAGLNQTVERNDIVTF